MKYLIAGLGNIGAEYENTRHNIGFKVVDAFAKASTTSFSTQRYGDIAEAKHKGRKFILLKPSTYMNLSGKAVSYWLQAEKIPIENLLVVTDDLALPFGTIRIKGKGSDGGHNGLKDIIATLNTNQWARFRFGVGAEFSQGRQVDYVLGQWNKEEEDCMEERIKRCVEAIKSFGLQGLGRTMNMYNNT